MSIISDNNLTGQASSLEQQYGLPPGLLTAQTQQEGGFTNGQNNYSTTGAYGLAQVLPSTAANPGYGVTPITMQQAGDPSQALTFMAQYDAGRINAAGGNVDAGISAYSGGAYTATSLGVAGGNQQIGSYSYSGNAGTGAGTAPGTGTNSPGGNTSSTPEGWTDNGDGTMTENATGETMRSLTIPGGQTDPNGSTSGLSGGDPGSSSVGSTLGTVGAGLGVASSLLGGNSSSTPAGIVANAENYVGDLFIRGAIILLGIIFVCVALMYFGSGGSVTPGKVWRTVKKHPLLAAA